MTVTLVSMVRNEAPRIARMIDSVAGFVDHAVILDTGSTDGTQDRAGAALAAHGISHEIHQAEWVDYGTCRTQLYSLAEDHDWQLLMDGDMTATIFRGLHDWLHSPEATADGYFVQMLQPGLEWRLPMLTRGRQTWTYVGAVHEGLDRTGREFGHLFPDNLSIWHHGDNGHDGKLEERLEQLLASPDDPHSVYYSAQTLRDLGRIPEAVEAYTRCAGMAGDLAHQWHAGYQAAALSGNLDALLALAEARPGRAEPLRAAAQLLTQRADRLVMPEGDLFVEPSAYSQSL